MKNIWLRSVARTRWFHGQNSLHQPLADVQLRLLL